MSHELVLYESLATVAMGPKNKSTLNLHNFERSYNLLSPANNGDNLLLQDFHDHVKQNIEHAAIDKTFGIRLLEDGKIVRHDFLQELVIEQYLITRIALMIAFHMEHLQTACSPQMEMLVTTALTKIPGDNLTSRLEQYTLTFGLQLRNYIFVFNFDAIIAASAMGYCVEFIFRMIVYRINTNPYDLIVARTLSTRPTLQAYSPSRRIPTRAPHAQCVKKRPLLVAPLFVYLFS